MSTDIPAQPPTKPLDLGVYQAVMDHAPWPMVEVDGATHIVRSVNQAFCKLLNKQDHEIIGKPLAELVPQDKSILPLLDRVSHTGAAEAHAETEHGAPHPIFWSYTCWPLQVGSTRRVGLMIQVTETSAFKKHSSAINEALLISAVQQHELADVADQLNVQLHDEMVVRQETEDALRESEGLNRSITESSPDCIKILDLDGKLLSMAERGQKLLCIPDITPYLGTSWIEFYQGAEDRAAAAAAVKKAAAGGEGNFIGFFADLNGEPKWWDVRISPIRDESGKPVKLLAVSRDVTDRRRTELALEETAKNLAEVDRRKSEFLATLAHELRNPLAPLRNGLELLSMADHDRATWDMAHGMMKRQLDQMVRLIDELMDLSRISRGTVDLRLERVDLRTVLEQAIESCKPLIDRQDHTLVVDIPETPVMVEGDGMRLTQVFSNLLNNAAKYTNTGGEITVTLAQDHQGARITVQDNGIGIAPDQLGKVFDMFAQVERANDRVQGGLGIGLNIVKHLVGMHGGTIKVRSDGLSKGSSFIVYLPISAEPAKQTIVVAHATVPAQAATPQRILVVDDNLDAATMMALLLGKLGHELRVANNGEEALAVGAELQPHVVLMDLGMPVMDGFAACRLMRKTSWGSKALIVALSGWGQDEDRAKSKEAGFDHHLVKPITSAALVDIIVATKGSAR